MTALTPLPGDFGLTQIHGRDGKLIRLGQFLNGSGFEDFEHAFIYVGGNMIVEAEPGGARLRPVSEYAYANVMWSTGHFQLTSQQRDAICLRAKQFYTANNGKGIPYSALDYLALAAHRLHLWAPFLKRYVESSGHVICSQLVDICYQNAGVKLFNDDRWPGYVTPGDLYGLLNA